MKLALTCAAVACGLAWIAVAEILSGDLWLGATTIGAAVYVFIISRGAARTAIQLHAPTADAPDRADAAPPSAGAIGAAPATQSER